MSCTNSVCVCLFHYSQVFDRFFVYSVTNEQSISHWSGECVSQVQAVHYNSCQQHRTTWARNHSFTYTEIFTVCLASRMMNGFLLKHSSFFFLSLSHRFDFNENRKYSTAILTSTELLFNYLFIYYFQSEIYNLFPKSPQIGSRYHGVLPIP